MSIVLSVLFYNRLEVYIIFHIMKMYATAWTIKAHVRSIITCMIWQLLVDNLSEDPWKSQCPGSKLMSSSDVIQPCFKRRRMRTNVGRFRGFNSRLKSDIQFNINSSNLLLLYVLLCWSQWRPGPLIGPKLSPQQPPAPRNPVPALSSEVGARRITTYQTTPI